MAGNEEWYDHNLSLQSCALAGAAVMIGGITDSLMIANGPSWCYFYALRSIDEPGLHMGQRFRCTYPANQAVVFGTEKDILDALGHVKEMSVQPKVVLLENSCALSLIGDDLQGIAESADLQCPIITLDSGGILGGFWAGYRKALKSLLKTVSIKYEPPKQPTVNLIGCCSSYYNEENDLNEIKRLLTLLGVKVNIMVGYKHNYQELEKLGNAHVNVVIHGELGKEGACWMQKQWGIPFIAPLLPYGLAGTLAWGETIIGTLLEMVDSEMKGMLVVRLKEFKDCVKEEGDYIFEHLKEWQRLWGEPYFDRLIVAGPGSVVQGMEAVLQSEWVRVNGVDYYYYDEVDGNNDSTNFYPSHYKGVSEEEKVHRIHDHKGNDIYQTDEMRAIDQTIQETWLVLGSNQEQKVLQRVGILSFDRLTIAKPVDDEILLTDCPLMGLRGNRWMLEKIWNLYMKRFELEGC